MHIWKLERWKEYYNYINVRSGIRLKFDQNVNIEVRRACKEFCKWVRTEYYFPIRVPIYVKSSYRIRTLDRDWACGTFFEPESKLIEPYIRIATGDYDDMEKNDGKDNALAAILLTITHELTHYFQWINDIRLTEIGIERQATSYAHDVLDAYKETREHP